MDPGHTWNGHQGSSNDAANEERASKTSEHHGELLSQDAVDNKHIPAAETGGETTDAAEVLDCGTQGGSDWGRGDKDGLATCLGDWLGGFLVQFFYYAPVGALLFACLLGLIQLLTWKNMEKGSFAAYPLSLLPAVAMFLYFCDENALVTSPIAIIASLTLTFALMKVKRTGLRSIITIFLMPLMYFLFGSVSILVPAVVAVRSLLRKEDRKKVHLALQSVPLGPQRANVGIYYKELPDDIPSITPESFAANWEKPYQVSDTTSAYSTMLLLKNGNIAFYYEESLTLNGRGYDMVYKEIPLEILTSGRYFSR